MSLINPPLFANMKALIAERLMRYRLNKFYRMVCAIEGKKPNPIGFEKFVEDWRDLYQESPSFYK
jgi:hypothetical protein